MKYLLNVPIIMKLAEWVWGNGSTGSIDVDKNDSTSTTKVIISAIICVNEFPFMSIDCWIQLIVKGLGIAVILGSFLNKAPIIHNILSSQSTIGLSRIALYGEMIMYTNCALYGILEGHPLTSFGENIALLLQTLIIIYLVWTLSKSTSVKTTTTTTVTTTVTTNVLLQEKLIVITFLISYIIINTILLHPLYRYLLISINLPIMLYSRGIQIYKTYTVQHTGAQSIITLSMNVTGALIRIVTTIKEIGYNLPILIAYTCSLLFSTLLIIQYFYYQTNTTKFLLSLQQQQQQSTTSGKNDDKKQQ